MKKQYIIFFIFCILLSSFAIAVPPVRQIFVGDVGISIAYPQYEYIKINNHYNLHTHIYNRSSGYHLTNDSASCLVHIYNNTGENIIEEDMSFDSNLLEYKLFIGGKNFSIEGKYAYIIQCNTSKIGGFVSGNFDITNDGKPNGINDSTSSISIILFLLSINMGLLFLFFRDKLFKNKFVDLISKRSILIIFFYLMGLTSTVIGTIADIGGIPVWDHLFMYTFIFLWAGYVAILYTFWKTIIDIMDMWKVDKNNERYGDE